MKKNCFVFMILTFFLLQSCTKYNYLNDKKVILNKEYIENHYKFTVTVYYNNPCIYFDHALEIGEIFDSVHENQKTYTLYERGFQHFCESAFENPPFAVKNDDEFRNISGNLKTLVDVRNENGDLIFWYSFNPDEKYMLLNNHLIERNDKLFGMAAIILAEDYILPENN